MHTTATIKVKPRRIILDMEESEAAELLALIQKKCNVITNPVSGIGKLLRERLGYDPRPWPY